MKKSNFSFLKKFFLFVLLFFVLSNLIVDSDFFWQLATGQYVLKTAEVLRGDVFSWTMSGYVWGNSYLIYQLIIAKIFEIFGYPFLVFLFGGLGALGFIILAKQVDFLRGLLIVMSAIMSLANLSVRPHVLSFLFFCGMLLALERKLYEKPYFGAIAFFAFALWANLHRGFVYALGFYIGFLLLNFLRDKEVNKWAMTALLLAVLGTLATPYSTLIWSGGVADDFKTFENLIYIAEWFPTVVFFPYNILFAVSGLVFVYMLFSNKHKIDPVWFVLGSLSFALAFILVNLLFFWAALFAFLVCRYFYVPEKYIRNIENYQKYFIVFVAIIGSIGFLLGLVGDIGKNFKFEKLVENQRFPVRAMNFIEGSNLDGNIFNEYQWGGFIEWRNPERKVFIDGRMAGWKRNRVSILGDYTEIKRGKCEPLEKYDIDLVLVDRSFDTKCFWDFKVIYEDNISKVLLKKTD